MLWRRSSAAPWVQAWVLMWVLMWVLQQPSMSAGERARNLTGACYLTPSLLWYSHFIELAHVQVGDSTTMLRSPNVGSTDRITYERGLIT